MELERWGLSEDSVPLRTALTHRSAADELSPSNERLEFLGDALLGAIIAEILYFRLPPPVDEAVLSRCRMQIVRRETLAVAGRALKLDEHLRVGEGERREARQKQDSLLADAYEAVLAALYIEQGHGIVREFVQETLGQALEAVVVAPPAPDAKTTLQVRLQAVKRGLPIYELIEESAAGVRVQVKDAEGVVLGVGVGRSKRLASQQAARQALAGL
jgi:ribonuclease-3